MANLPNLSSLETISKRIQYLSENDPDRELFVFYQGKTRDPYTSRQIFQQAGKFANRLRHQYGFQRNDIIANTLPNSPERLITDVGITLAGCTCMNGQILLADGSDFLLSARNSRCRGVIIGHEEDFPAWELLKPYITGDTSSDITGLSCDNAPDMTSAILVSRTTYTRRQPLLEDLRNSDEEVFIDTTIGPEDLLVIFTTSGSTGYSKLVPRTHADVIDNFVSTQNLDNGSDTTEHFVLYNDSHIGWAGGNQFITYCGGTKRVLMNSYYSYGKKTGDMVWNAICAEKCNTAVIFPLELDSILKYISSPAAAHYKLKIVATGAQPVKKSQLERMLAIGEQICIFYGSTEQNLISSGIITGTNVEDFFCGKPAANIKLRVVDEKGEDCKPCQTGTLLVNGEMRFQGYFNRLQNPDPDTIKCFTKDGWFNTEDTGFLNEDGNVYVLGRNKDTITYGAVVLYPGWLEAKILQHPDIAEACVLPVVDPILFHNICACVKRNVGSDLNEEKLKIYCESIFVADVDDPKTPMPKYFMVLEHFPETASGKPDKQALRKMAEDTFGLDKINKT